jgi:hypothetical protein
MMSGQAVVKTLLVYKGVEVEKELNVDLRRWPDSDRTLTWRLKLIIPVREDAIFKSIVLSLSGTLMCTWCPARFNAFE